MEELRALRDEIENKTSALDTSPLEDLADRINNYLESHDPDGENEEDPVLGSAASLGCSLEDLVSVIIDLRDAIEEVDSVLNNDD